MSIDQLARAAADIRKACAPAPGSPKSVSVACPECGHVYVYVSGKRKTKCPDCAARHRLAYHEQLRTKSGPLYENFVRGQLEHWSAELERLRGGDAQ